MLLRRYTAYFIFYKCIPKEVEPLPFALTSNLLSSLQQSYFISICNLLNQRLQHLRCSLHRQERLLLQEKYGYPVWNGLDLYGTKRQEKYHSSPNCRGLNRCSGSIKSLSVSAAKSKGFSPCRICYRQFVYKLCLKHSKKYVICSLEPYS